MEMEAVTLFPLVDTLATLAVTPVGALTVTAIGFAGPTSRVTWVATDRRLPGCALTCAAAREITRCAVVGVVELLDEQAASTPITSKFKRRFIVTPNDFQLPAPRPGPTLTTLAATPGPARRLDPEILAPEFRARRRRAAKRTWDQAPKGFVPRRGATFRDLDTSARPQIQRHARSRHSPRGSVLVSAVHQSLHRPRCRTRSGSGSQGAHP